MHRRTLFPLLGALLFAGTLGFTFPLPVMGPPWIAIEVPPNPYDRASRDAFLLVHAFHHGTPRDFPVTGVAEGLVDGKRQQVKLDFTRTSRDGVFALKKMWPSAGSWVLVINVHQGDAKATALVELSTTGQVASVDVPTKRQNGWTVPREVSQSEIEQRLQRRVVANRGG